VDVEGRGQKHKNLDRRFVLKSLEPLPDDVGGHKFAGYFSVWDLVGVERQALRRCAFAFGPTM
jgi:hypothetical protein